MSFQLVEGRDDMCFSSVLKIESNWSDCCTRPGFDKINPNQLKTQLWLNQIRSIRGGAGITIHERSLNPS